jgi:hypothetical protein
MKCTVVGQVSGRAGYRDQNEGGACLVEKARFQLCNKMPSSMGMTSGNVTGMEIPMPTLGLWPFAGTQWPLILKGP